MVITDYVRKNEKKNMSNRLSNNSTEFGLFMMMMFLGGTTQ